MSGTKRMLAGAAVVAGVLGMSAPAWAADCPTASPNCQQPTIVKGIELTTPPAAVAAETTPARPAPAATLPFTGADVAELALIGGLAVAGGAVLVRSGRKRTHDTA